MSHSLHLIAALSRRPLVFLGHSGAKWTHQGAPSHFTRLGGGEKKKGRVITMWKNWMLKLGVIVAQVSLRARHGAFPLYTMPSGLLLTTNKINKSEPSTQEQSVRVGDLPYSKNENKFFFHSFLIHFLSPIPAVHSCFSTFHLIYVAFFRKYGRKTTVLSLLLIRQKNPKTSIPKKLR